MAKITYTDKEALNEIPSIPAINKVQANDMNEIKNVVNQNELKVLLIVDSSAPAECSTGDMYYNTTTKLIYTATGTNTWGSTGVNPTQNTLYIDSTNKSTYFYDGSDLISVGGGAGGESLKIGTIVPFAGSTIPDGYLTCDGTAVSRTTYSDLFAVIGTTYGSGDGSTTFNLPNLKGRVPVGLDSNDTDFDTLGEIGGEKAHTLTVGELPSGVEVLKYASQSSTWGLYVNNTPYQLQAQGGQGQAHNILQPYLVVNYIIKATKTTPVQAEIVNSYSTSTTDGYSCNEVNNLVQDVYSTDEVKTNKIWFGKPVYRKVLELTNVPRGYQVYDHNIDNFGDLADVYGTFKEGATQNPIIKIAADNLSTFSMGVVDINATQIHTLLGSSIPTTNTMKIVLEYTKTTD